MGMIVLVRGYLRGMGREADCEVVAMKRTIEHMRKSRRHFEEIYSEFGVIDAPPDLPDGDYTVQIGKHVFTTTRRRGLWLSRCEPVNN